MRKLNLYLGSAVSVWLLTIMVITAELSAPFKGLLIAIFSHHWIGKAVIITLAFVITGFLFKETKANKKIAWYSVIGSLVVIFLFYTLEFLI